MFAESQVVDVTPSVKVFWTRWREVIAAIKHARLLFTAGTEASLEMSFTVYGRTGSRADSDPASRLLQIVSYIPWAHKELGTATQTRAFRPPHIRTR